MRLALAADLHGNLHALRSMDKALQRWQADEIWFLGDAVGKGPDNRETCDWVRQNCTRLIGGNWDYGVGFQEFPGDAFYWDQLGEERLAWLRSLPREMEATISGIRFRLFHGRPVTDLMHVQDDRDKLARTFQKGNERFSGVIFADSHRPFVRTLNEGYMANTGSVGNSMGVPKAHALLIEGELNCPDPAPLMMTILSVPYDNQAAVQAALAAKGMPKRDAYIREITTGIYSR